MPSFVLAKKLKALKEDIRWWNIREIGTVGVNKKWLLEELVRLYEKDGVNGLTLAEKMERDGVISEVKQLASLEEILLRQKSRVLWLKEGDNKKFFHWMENSHRRNNHLGNLEADGVVYEEESEVIDQVVGFYQKLYMETETWRLVVDDLNFDNIGVVENGLLE